MTPRPGGDFWEIHVDADDESRVTRNGRAARRTFATSNSAARWLRGNFTPGDKVIQIEDSGGYEYRTDITAQFVKAARR